MRQLVIDAYGRHATAMQQHKPEGEVEAHRQGYLSVLASAKLRKDSVTTVAVQQAVMTKRIEDLERAMMDVNTLVVESAESKSVTPLFLVHIQQAYILLGSA